MTQFRLDLSAEDAERIDGLAKACGADGRVEVVALALRVLKWVADEAGEGRRIASLGLGSDDCRFLAFPPVRPAPRRSSTLRLVRGGLGSGDGDANGSA